VLMALIYLLSLNFGHLFTFKGQSLIIHFQRNVQCTSPVYL
jgi:hypothetical protein